MNQSIEPPETEALRIWIQQNCRTQEFEDRMVKLAQSRDVLAEAVYGMQKQVGELMQALLEAEQENMRLKLKVGESREPQLPKIGGQGRW